MTLERAIRPSGCSKPGTLTRQSRVPGFSIHLFSIDHRIFKDLNFHSQTPLYLTAWHKYKRYINQIARRFLSLNAYVSIKNNLKFDICQFSKRIYQN